MVERRASFFWKLIFAIFVAFIMAQLLLFVFDMKKLLEIRSFYHRALNISEVCPWRLMRRVLDTHYVLGLRPPNRPFHHEWESVAKIDTPQELQLFSTASYI
jgi:hypothetical protein